MEDWLRGCVYHDGRHGDVTLPTDKVLEIANYIQLTRRSVSDGLIDLKVEPIADTPQTESTGSPIGDYRDGVGAWQTDCEDRYAVRNDSGEVVAHACPLGCEQTDCPWK